MDENKKGMGELGASVTVVAAPVRFSVLHYNREVARVEVDWRKEKVRYKQYSDLIWDLPFPEYGTGEGATSTDRLLKFFESRCFPRSRGDANQVLKSLGLSNYSPLGIVRRTHGVIFDDHVWIKFEGEEGLNYERAREGILRNYGRQ